jgi:hypothetical protein
MAITDMLKRLRSALSRECKWRIGRQRTPEGGPSGCNVRVTHGDTGRSYDFSGAEAEQVVSWTKCESTQDLLGHPSAKRFRQLIRSNPLVTAEELVAFRGRFRDDQMYPNVQSSHFGPPPPEKTKPGRYNVSGKPVVYLSSSEEGVFCELKRRGEPVKYLFCQRFRIPTKRLKIADFSPNRTENFVSLVFSYAERGTRSGQIDRSDYRFSQVVAKLLQKGGFDGMAVPGVRGGRICKYNNVVIFRPDAYADWVDRNSQPQCIDALEQQIQQEPPAATNPPPQWTPHV